MIDHLKGKENLIKLVLLLVALSGFYLIVAWASYSPLDNGWTVASSATNTTLNKTGALGAWLTDIQFALFGKVAFLLPFGFTFGAIYALALKLAEQLKWWQISLWGLSFILLLAGLAGLASVLFSSSPYYLAGGVIGAMLSDLIGSQFALLFIAMLLTAMGFYFCSGQILLGLFNRLYHWVLEGKDEKETQKETAEITSQTAMPSIPVEPESTATVSEPDTKSTLEVAQPEPSLTDISIFSRPNITGLKPTAPQTPTLNVDNATLVNPAMFKVENPTPLPQVNLAESDPIPQIVSSNIEMPSELAPQFEANEQAPVMPKVKLNPVAEATPITEPESPLQAVEIEPKIATPEVQQPQFMQNAMMSQVQLEPVETAEITPSVELAPQMEKESLSASEKKPVTYPKSYGESLIHPLLQPKKPTAKPTSPFPSLDLLEKRHVEVEQLSEQEILETSARLQQELANFGIKATVEDVLVGPVVTRYEIKPAAGVKANKITSLDSDLARALIFKAIRITDVVPGKPYMGIETPNPQRETVWLRDVLASEEFRQTKAKLPMALGKDISGEPVVVDMAKMPHLLVAGQTGGGKSVGLNSMILSLLFKLTPEQVRFIMIDPKVVELSIYNDIPHLLTPVVTDMKKAENALRWAVEEMERRYLLVSSLNVRNIDGYNAKIEQAEEMGLPIPNMLWRPGDTMDAIAPPLEKLPYIVLIVDEFADLMMSAGKQVEDHIMRIAQKARAVGIHLILATQRPSTDVITGVIKANIPSRIAFTVASQIDSRTILDKGGAESLLGYGDMLYSAAGSPDIIRVHGAYMSDEDVERVAEDWRARGKPEYIENIINANDDNENSANERETSKELDPLFDEVAQFMIETGNTSISVVQRRFSIGFTRAGRIVDQLEEQGILSAPDSRNRREILAR